MSSSPPTLDSPPRKSLQQCFHVNEKVTLSIQLTSSSALRSSNSAKDIQIGIDYKLRAYSQIHQNRNLIDRGTQTTVSNEQSISEESELRLVKEQLRNEEKNGAYLSDRVKTYRDRWLEEYYRANNLEYHIPSDIHVADLPQIPEGLSSPKLFSDCLEWEEDNSFGCHV
ncbi:uncharacterized protein F5891DRAFT_983200 [Suillus fuscotomentosus]|uniref:Uncharacterized protein n=1 Tax=Suillus fuscotomentosus TaxID=1912939 RepID=A0AAD4E1X2_9AGAM|nr:uncharacterized protein F5891DRAFT_983200 [Suillus fuscotomentosus]KAG1896778.1 hypothetical protein F5891DRAFT_983200 [Suillus fuscotomentosus]